jgi:hypothetical protein
VLVQVQDSAADGEAALLVSHMHEPLNADRSFATRIPTDAWLSDQCSRPTAVA